MRRREAEKAKLDEQSLSKIMNEVSHFVDRSAPINQIEISIFESQEDERLVLPEEIFVPPSAQLPKINVSPSVIKFEDSPYQRKIRRI